MSPEEEAVLEKDGWIVECYSPLEIRHDETNSFATGLAVRYVIEHLQGNEEGLQPC